MTNDPSAAVRGALSPCGTTSDFDLDPAAAPRERTAARPAAVLLALLEADGGPRVVLTRRSARLRHHPGQIALPGGKIDAADASPEAAALREAEEEIGLRPANVELWGRLPPHQTVTGFSILPIVGRIRAPFAWVPERGEVDEVFAVPLRHLLDPASYRVEWRLWRGGRRHYYVVPWGPYYIWGATARVLRGLAERVAAR